MCVFWRVKTLLTLHIYPRFQGLDSFNNIFSGHEVSLMVHLFLVRSGDDPLTISSTEWCYPRNLGEEVIRQANKCPF